MRMRAVKVGLVVISDEKVCHSLIPEAEPAALMPPLSSWLMVGEWELLCAVERLPHENREGRQAPWTETKGAFNGAGSLRIRCWTWRGSGVTARSHGDSPPFRGALGPSLAIHCGGQQVFWGVTSTQCDKPLWYDHCSHPRPSPSFYHLGQLSEDPSLGTTTGKDGDSDSASHGFSPRHFTLMLLCSVSFLSLFFSPQASGFLCSFCVYGTFTRVSPRHTPHVTLPSMATLPGARLQSEARSAETLWHITNNSSYSLILMDEALKAV